MNTGFGRCRPNKKYVYSSTVTVNRLSKGSPTENVFGCRGESQLLLLCPPRGVGCRTSLMKENYYYCDRAVAGRAILLSNGCVKWTSRPNVLSRAHHRRCNPLIFYVGITTLAL